MFIKNIININAEINKKLWNNFILNRLNVELYYNFCKNESKKVLRNLSYNLLKRLNNKFIQNLIIRRMNFKCFLSMFYFQVIKSIKF